MTTRSVQAAVMPTAYLPCRALQKHALDGYVVQERVDGRVVWVASLQCTNCGTWRHDVMKPKTCELISRSYSHPDDYDGSLSPAEARKLLFQHMMENGVTLASLAG